MVALELSRAERTVFDPRIVFVLVERHAERAGALRREEIRHRR
jgi:hypothetical protein